MKLKLEKMILILLFVILINFLPSIIFAEEILNYPIGVVHIASESLPSSCYTIVRQDKTIMPDYQNQKIFNGDIVFPVSKECTFTVKYFHTECSTLTSDKQPIYAECDPSRLNTPGWFAIIMDKILKSIKPSQKDMPEMVTHKSSNSNDPTYCYDKVLRVSPWPKNGTSVLSGKPVFFRIDDYTLDSCLPCSKAMLAISNGSQYTTIPITIGKTLKVDSFNFIAGVSYHWFIKMNENRISPIYTFKILDNQSTININKQLDKIVENNNTACIALKQALYLQIISKATPGLSLYSDSMRIMLDHSHCQNELWQVLENGLFSLP
jgi:hypothetical protein